MLIGSHRKLRRRRTLQVEAFEERLPFDSEGLLWGNEPYLTLSFAPDGTDTAGQPNELTSFLDNLGSTEEWQTTILRAFHTWARETNADVGLVGDSGAPFGVGGPTRGDERFGDIRVGAIPMSPDILAVSIPHDGLMFGTWVGDLIFNSAAHIHTLEEVYAITLHEAGHIFGLEHSPDPDSPMHHHGITPNVTLTPADITALQTLYGQRIADGNEIDTTNDTMGTATTLAPFVWDSNLAGSAPSLSFGDVSTEQDIDYFRLPTLSSYTGSVTIEVVSSGLSLLAPEISVQLADGTVLDTSVSQSSHGDRLSLHIPQLERQDYFVRVAGNPNSVFPIGGYAVVVTYDDINQTTPQELDAFLTNSFRFLTPEDAEDFLDADDDDYLDGDDDDTQIPGPPVEELESLEGLIVEDLRYEKFASISAPGDVDRYLVESPDEEVLPSPTMFVLVNSLDPAGLIPSIRVTNLDLVELPAQIIANGNGEFMLQLADVDVDEEFIVEVEAAANSGPFNTGNYRLSVVYGTAPITSTNFAQGQIDTEPQEARTLFVAQPQIFHFALSTDPIAQPTDTLVRAQLLNESDEVVVDMATSVGDTRTLTSRIIPPGTYQLLISRVDGRVPATVPLTWSLDGSVITRPVGASPSDPTGEFACPDSPDEFCFPNGVRLHDSFLWDQWLAQLPGLPTVSDAEYFRLVLGEWWSWVWSQNGGNTIPEATSDAYQLPAVQPLQVTSTNGVLSNDTDAERTPLVAWLDTPPQHGDVFLEPDGSFQYIPDFSFSSEDSFTYRAFDFQDNSAPTTVRISLADNTAPSVGEVRLNADRIDPGNLATGVQPTSWQRQRSQLASLQIVFTQPVQITAQDVTLRNLGVDSQQTPPTVIPLTSTQLSHQAGVLTIEFMDSPLPDGVYQLEISEQVIGDDGLQLDGNGDSVPGGNYVLTGSLDNGLHQLTGDWNGDGRVSIFDFNSLAYWFASPSAPAYLDLNGDGGTSIFDWAPFAANFSSGIAFPAPAAARNAREALVPVGQQQPTSPPSGTPLHHHLSAPVNDAPTAKLPPKRFARTQSAQFESRREEGVDVFMSELARDTRIAPTEWQ